MQINIENKPLELISSKELSTIYTIDFLPHIKKAKERQGLIIYKGWRIWCVDKNNIWIYSPNGDRYFLIDCKEI